MSDAREVLSALIDREPVDPDVLAQVLEEPEGRAMLVDFVRVRVATLADGLDEQAWRPEASGDGHALPATGYGLPAAGTARAQGEHAAHGARLAAHGSRRWLRAAAALLLLVAGAGGGAWAERYVSRERPPEPDRIVKLEPVNAASAR